MSWDGKPSGRLYDDHYEPQPLRSHIKCPKSGTESSLVTIHYRHFREDVCSTLNCEHYNKCKGVKHRHE